MSSSLGRGEGIEIPIGFDPSSAPVGIKQAGDALDKLLQKQRAANKEQEAAERKIGQIKDEVSKKNRELLDKYGSGVKALGEAEYQAYQQRKREAQELAAQQQRIFDQNQVSDAQRTRDDVERLAQREAAARKAAADKKRADDEAKRAENERFEQEMRDIRAASAADAERFKKQQKDAKDAAVAQKQAFQGQIAQTVVGTAASLSGGDAAKAVQIQKQLNRLIAENRQQIQSLPEVLRGELTVEEGILRLVKDENIQRQALARTEQALAGTRDRLFRREQLNLRDLAFGLQQIADTGKRVFDPAIDEARKVEAEFALIKKQVPSKEFDELKKGASDLNPALGKVSDNAEQLFEILQAGVKSTDALDFLKQGAIAARGDFEKTSDAVAAGIPVYAAFGKEIKSASDLFDRLQVTVDEGRVKFAQLPAALGPLIATAQSSGIALNELLAAFAALSVVQGPQQASTSLANAIKAIVDPTSEAREQAKLLGIEFSASALRSRGFVQILRDISSHGGAGQKVLQSLFPEIRGVRGAAFLAGEGLERMDEALRKIDNSSGRSAEKFEEWSKTTDAAIQAAEGALSRFQVSLGESIAGLVRLQLEAGTKTLSAIQDLNEGLGGVPAQLGFLATEAAAALATMTLLAVGARQTAFAFGLTEKAVAGALRYITLIPAAFTAGLSFGKYLVENFDSVRQLSDRLADKLAKTTEEAGKTAQAHAAQAKSLRDVSDAQAEVNARLEANRLELEHAGQERIKQAKDEADRLEALRKLKKAEEDLKRARDEGRAPQTAGQSQQFTVGGDVGPEELQRAQEAQQPYLEFAAEMNRRSAEARAEIAKMSKALFDQGPQLKAATDHTLRLVAGYQTLKPQIHDNAESTLNLSRVMKGLTDVEVAYDDKTNTLIITNKRAAAAAEELAKSQKTARQQLEEDFEKTTEFITIRNKLAESTKEYRSEVDKLRDALRKDLASTDTKSIFDPSGRLISGPAFKEAERDILDFTETVQKRFGLTFAEAKRVAADLFNDLRKESEDSSKGFDKLYDSLGKGNKDIQENLAALGSSLQQAFDAGNYGEIKRIVNDISKEYGVSIPDALELARQATDKFRQEQKRAAAEAERAAKQLDKAWDDFYLKRLRDTDKFQGSLQRLAAYINSQQDTPGVFLSLNTIISRDTEAIEAFASKYGLELPEAIRLAEQASEEYARNQEKNAKEIQDAFTQLDDYFTAANKDYQKAVQDLGQSVARLQQSTTNAGSNAEAVFLRQEKLISDFAEDWGITLPNAIKIATQAAEEYDRKQEEASERAKEAFRQAVQQANKDFADFLHSGTEATDEFQDALKQLGEDIAHLRERGDIRGQQAEVIAFARAWGEDFTTALSQANQASNQFTTEQKAKTKAIEDAWKGFARSQLEASDEYKGALQDLGQELLRYQGQQDITRLTVESFARHFDLELPQAIQIAGQALQQAQAEVEKTRQAEEAYLKQVNDLWAQYDKTRLEASSGFQSSLADLGQALVKHDADLQLSKNEVAAFAQKYSLELPDAIHYAIQAYSDAARASSDTSGQLRTDADKNVDAWNKYWNAVVEGSAEYQASLKALGAELAKETNDQKLTQATVIEFSKKWKIDLPEAIDESIAALSEARSASGDTADSIGDDADKIAESFDEFRDHILRSNEDYSTAARALGELVSRTSGDIRSLEPQIQGFADTWHYSLPDAIREAERAYDDVQEASRRAADQAEEDAQRIEDSFKSYFEAFQKESAEYKRATEALGEELVALGSNVEGQRAKIQAFASAWGLDLNDAIHEAEASVRKVLDAQEEAGGAWGKLQNYAQASTAATQAALQSTAGVFASTATSAQNLGTQIQTTLKSADQSASFKSLFTKNVSDPIDEATKKAQALAAQTKAIYDLYHGNPTGAYPTIPSFVNVNNSAPGYDFGKFQSGGAFVVPGTGGTDSSRVTFRATPNEVVTVTPQHANLNSLAPLNSRGNQTPVTILIKDSHFYGEPTQGVAMRWAKAIGNALGQADRTGQVPALRRKAS